ncbi:hypothetical protein QVD17_36840 [Tagetes erecta]|uniref:Replication factor A C-terminal domain-containing protein n=1 Tax=Tagetes erecta TaxID=13708 RepID=A0AAD8JZF5_TARER|nr:hypothetical protein QVD17_36840 [Tagetes erecta]
MEHNNITLIKNVDLSNADLTMKLRIVRLWKLPDHINKKEVYSIEMILMDEEIFLNSHGFSFTSLKAINEHSVSEDLSIDVIGEVQDLQPIKTFLNGEGNLTKQATFKIRDSEGQVMSVTLFAEYAEQFIEYLQKHPEEVRLIVILQFGRINVTINDKSNSISTNLSKGSFISIPTDDELFIKTEFINIEELSEIKEPKHVVILATLISFIEEKPWGYLGCTKCYKKVEPLLFIDDKPKSPAELDEPTIYRCPKCLIDVRIPIPRFRIEMRVQDHTGVVSLTLFDREAKKLLKIFAKDLIGGSQSRDYIGGSHSKDVMQSNQQVSDFLDYPPLLNTLLHRKFAFKIEISSFVLDHNLPVYGINKLSADDGIISQLNQKVDTQTAQSDSERVSYLDMTSQDTVTLKDVVSVTDDNVTPASNTEKSTATSPLVRAKNSAVSSTTSHLKRNLSEAYDFDPLTANLSTKLPRGYVLTDPSDAIKLLEPKMEK